MPIYNSDYLRQLSKNKSKILLEARFAESRNLKEFDIFLSHSFLDKEEVEGIYIELTNMNYKVYVDWIVDPHLNRNNVTKETSELIRTRMKSSKGLLLAVSTNAGASKWMPWELGYMDGNTKGNCAILPVAPEKQTQISYKGFEYLSLYPYVKKENLQGNKLWVAEDLNKHVDFNNWLLNNRKPQYQNSFIY